MCTSLRFHLPSLTFTLSSLFLAQLHLPPEGKCNLEFLGQLLKGEKKAVALCDLRPVKVSDRQYITVKRVVAQVQHNDVYMKYLPDKPLSCGRAFLFNVVNTIDPEYFRRAQAEVDRLRIKKGKKEKAAEVEICPAMKTLLDKYVGLNTDRKASA